MQSLSSPRVKMGGVVVVTLLLGGLLFLGIRGDIAIPQELNVLGVLSLRLYSLVSLCAVLLGLFIFEKLRTEDRDLMKLDLWEGVLYLLIPGLIGARIYHVLTDFYIYQNDLWEIFAIWDGGVGFIGGVIGGAIGAYFFSRKHNVRLARILGLLAVVLPFSHAVARLGNFFNRELYGLPTDLPWGILVETKYRNLAYFQYEYFHPLFLYEAIGNLLLGCLIYYMWKRKIHDARLVMAYLAGYGTLRYLLDFLRIDGRTGVGAFSYAQLLVLAGFLFVVAFGTAYQVWYKRKYGVWFTGKTANGR